MRRRRRSFASASFQVMFVVTQRAEHFRLHCPSEARRRSGRVLRIRREWAETSVTTSPLGNSTRSAITRARASWKRASVEERLRGIGMVVVRSPWSMVHGSASSHHGLRTTDYGLRTTDPQLPHRHRDYTMPSSPVTCPRYVSPASREPGFQDIRQKTALEFHPQSKKERRGLTGIVGPERIGQEQHRGRHPLGDGEQSMKLLRGKGKTLSFRVRRKRRVRASRKSVLRS